MLKMWVNKRVSFHDKDVDVITYMKLMLVNERLTFHNNHVLRVYLYDENKTKLTSIALWQPRWRDNVYEVMKVIKQLSFHNNHVSRVNLYALNVSERATVHPPRI